MKKIDLSHTLSSDIPHWDGDCCFRVENTVDYPDCTAPNLFRVQRINLKAGAGTHIDAPAHCIPGGKTIADLSLDNLVTDCVVITTITNKSDHVISADEIKKFETEHGNIQPNTFVIFYTSWDQYWNDPDKYRNNLKFPSVGEDAVELLLERDVAGIGIDTLSPDAAGEDFPVHRALLGAGKFIVENVANASELPVTGAKILIMPLKIKDGTESPIRLVGLI